MGERGGAVRLNVILNDLRSTDSNVWACLLSSGTERKQSTGVKQKHYPSPWSRREGDKPPSLQFNSYVAWSFPMEIICPPTINVCLMWFYKSNIIWAATTDGTSLRQLVRFLNQAIYKHRLAIEPLRPPPFCFDSVFPRLCEEQMPATLSWHFSFCGCQSTSHNCTKTCHLKRVKTFRANTSGKP